MRKPELVIKRVPAGKRRKLSEAHDVRPIEGVRTDYYKNREGELFLTRTARTGNKSIVNIHRVGNGARGITAKGIIAIRNNTIEIRSTKMHPSLLNKHSKAPKPESRGRHFFSVFLNEALRLSALHPKADRITIATGQENYMQYLKKFGFSFENIAGTWEGVMELAPKTVSAFKKRKK